MIDAAAIKIIFHDIDEHDKKEAQKAMVKIFDMFLDGKKLKDYSGNLWKANKCECSYSSGYFFSVDIYLDGYNTDYSLYGDWEFEKRLQECFPFLYITYSESGMQGEHHINLDVWAAKDARGTK